MATLRINSRFVKEMLHRQEMDQVALAQKAGISEPTMIRLMQGKPFASETLGRIAEALGCSPIDLLDVSEYPDPHMAAPTPVV
jgi:DNA-binding Xre family transcriptional regulator